LENAGGEVSIVDRRFLGGDSDGVGGEGRYDKGVDWGELPAGEFRVGILEADGIVGNCAEGVGGNGGDTA
jgi:hypothetical protein